MTGSCPVCGAANLIGFLTRNGVPAHQNLVYREQAAAREAVRGDLDMVVCAGCDFVFNRAFDPVRLHYGDRYDNAQSHSPFFDEYLDSLVALLSKRGVQNCTVVEVGCGRGYFLRKLVSQPESGLVGYGFDPSYVGPEMDLGGRLRFRASMYDATCSETRADVVLCRHVIEHVPEPLDLIDNVRAALASSPQARVFFETPCVEWILHNRVIWDFFYEHCSLFTASSLATAFERRGFDIVSVEHVFGGQYLWLEARQTPETTRSTTLPRHAQLATLAREYGEIETRLRERWRERIRDLRQRGGVSLWGAGAKGTTFANLVDPDAELLDSLVDINPNKRGCFVPGSGHRIIGPADILGRDVRSAILMNPNYRDETHAILRDASIEIELLDWSHP